MKKKSIIKSLSVILLVFGLLAGAAYIGSAVLLGIMVESSETFLKSSASPDGTYQLEAYRTEPGATDDFSVKVYRITDGEKELIYNAYHERNAEIKWVSEVQVSINGKELDLSKNETFDWRD